MLKKITLIPHNKHLYDVGVSLDYSLIGRVNLVLGFVKHSQHMFLCEIPNHLVLWYNGRKIDP